MSFFAPVVVFAYRRPDHLHNMLTTLMLCEGFSQSPVVVYCDGPRDMADVEAVKATRELARKMLGERAEYYFSEENLGLSHSVIAGVTEVLNRFGRAIVLEDDLDLDTSFLIYMNQALDRYDDDVNVFQISGYIHDVPQLQDSVEALFLPFTVSWGWATWKRAWDQFDLEAKGWRGLIADKKLRRRFNLDGTYDYTTMLLRQISGLRDSWAIRWYWTVFKSNGLVLFPPISLVKNVGFDGSGTHGTGFFRRFSSAEGFKARVNRNIELPLEISIDTNFYSDVKTALWKKNGGWFAHAFDHLKRLFNL